MDPTTCTPLIILIPGVHPSHVAYATQLSSSHAIKSIPNLLSYPYAHQTSQAGTNITSASNSIHNHCRYIIKTCFINTNA